LPNPTQSARRLLALGTGRTLVEGVWRRGLAFFRSRLGSLGKRRKLPHCRVRAEAGLQAKFTSFAATRPPLGKGENHSFRVNYKIIIMKLLLIIRRRHHLKVFNDADIDLFRKMTRAHHCAHSLLPPGKSGAHNLRPKGHTYELPIGVIQRCIKTHLYPVAFIGMCNFSHCICVFIFLFEFHCILCYMLYQLSACRGATSVTCTLKDQSINKSLAVYTH